MTTKQRSDGAERTARGGSCRRSRSKVLRALCAVAAAVLLLSPAAFAESHSASAGLRLEVWPAAQVEQHGNSVIVLIRLAKGATALLWTGADCTHPANILANMRSSGAYSFAADGAGERVCLQSSDGALSLSAPRLQMGMTGATSAGSAPSASASVPADE